MLRVGINPYGVSYTVLGWPGGGTPRANPDPWGLSRYLDLAAELGARVVEIPMPLLENLDDAGWNSLLERLAQMDAQPVASQTARLNDIQASLKLAARLGARILRVSATSVLAGGRAFHKPPWREVFEGVVLALAGSAPRAADAGIALAIENHQDFTSVELLGLCAPYGPHVGICLDTGNALAVGEDPIAFVRAVAPRVRHVHLKDYKVQWTAEGYRLLRCATGHGAIPFEALLKELKVHHAELPAALEPGALEARHVRVLNPSWWSGYSPRPAEALAAGLAAARKGLLAEHEEWRTPWELGAGSADLVAFELEQLRASAEWARSRGLMAPKGSSAP